MCRCDNMAVVNILYSRTSKDNAIMHLVRSLHFFLAHWDIKLTASHIAGKSNVLADALSGNLMQVFHKQAPTAHKEGSGLHHSSDTPRIAHNREARLVLAKLETEAEFSQWSSP